jgi:hypothetical protein
VGQHLAEVQTHTVCEEFRYPLDDLTIVIDDTPLVDGILQVTLGIAEFVLEQCKQLGPSLLILLVGDLDEVYAPRTRARGVNCQHSQSLRYDGVVKRTTPLCPQ